MDINNKKPSYFKVNINELEHTEMEINGLGSSIATRIFIIIQN